MRYSCVNYYSCKKHFCVVLIKSEPTCVRMERVLSLFSSSRGGLPSYRAKTTMNKFDYSMSAQQEEKKKTSFTKKPRAGQVGHC